MSSMSLRHSKTTKSCPGELDFICNQLVLWNKRQLVTADNVSDTMASFLEIVTTDGLTIALGKPVSFRFFWQSPWPLDLNPRYSGAMIRVFNGLKATCTHRSFALTHDTSGHGFGDIKGTITRSRSPPVQLRPCLHAGGNPGRLVR